MSGQITQELEATGVASVIVVLKGPAAAAASERVSDLEKYFVSSELSQESALVTAAATKRARTRTRGSQPSMLPPMRYYPHLGIAYGTVTQEGLDALRTDKERVAEVTGAPPISLIRPRRIVAARLTRRNTWGIEELGVPELWKNGLSGKGIKVGHLDTGVDGRHPALKTAIAAFAQFDDLGRLVTPSPKPFDTDQHGTHTAGTIAGRPIGGRHFGVAPGSRLASAIVIEGGNVVARVLGGMDWVIGQGVQILSMSLGFRGLVPDFLPLTRIVRARNVLPVFAVGNEGPGTSRSPGNYSEALSVGAIDENLTVADFSSSQRFRRKEDPFVPDVVAPGVNVISARPGGGYQSMDGTSMATPHVAGLAALLFEAKPHATVAEVEQAIFASCRREPGMAPERADRGIPNGSRALTALGG